MKNTPIFLLMLTILPPVSVLGQGPLIPSSSPAASMKSLDQIEPRTLIVIAPFTVTNSGSYYLAKNLKGAVNIGASHVTLDLMGFTIEAASGTAINMLGSFTNILIRNGMVRAPSGNGIDLSLSSSRANSRIQDLQVRGCSLNGILVGSGVTVSDCMVDTAALSGIRMLGQSEVRKCVITGCGIGLQATGKGGQVAQNRVYGNTDNYAFSGGNHLNLMLSEVPEIISWPCSVRFAGSLICTNTGVHGITVEADNVSIDLDGHALVGPGAGSFSGIYQTTNAVNLQIANGYVTQWGSTNHYGIEALGRQIQVSAMNVSSNGNGCYLRFRASLSDSLMCKNKGYGVLAFDGGQIRNCTATDNSGTGFYAFFGRVEGCYASGNGQGFAISESSSLLDSSAVSNYRGVTMDSKSLMSRCQVTYSIVDGLIVDDRCTVEHSLFAYNAYGGSYNGILVTGNDNRIDSNNLAGNQGGIKVTASGNFITRNTVSGGSNWDIAAGNVCLVVSAATGGAFTGNAGGTAPGSTDPNANFTY